MNVKGRPEERRFVISLWPFVGLTARVLLPPVSCFCQLPNYGTRSIASRKGLFT
jgi:hypothetical protein